MVPRSVRMYPLQLEGRRMKNLLAALGLALAASVLGAPRSVTHATSLTAPRHVMLTLTGGNTHGGATSTKKFHVSRAWQVQYKHDCSRIGVQQPFAISVYDFYGPNSAAAAINVSGVTVQGTHRFSHPGTYELLISASCPWKIRVTS